MSGEDDEDDGGKIDVRLAAIGGQEYNVSIEPAADVWSLKQCVWKEYGIPKRNQILLLGGDVVKSNAILEDLVVDGALEFTLVVSLASCMHCGQQNRMKRCSKCDSYYCNALCQRADWERHKQSGLCGMFATVRF